MLSEVYWINLFKFAPYSFSKLNLHQQCNKRFKYNYIDKIPREKTDMAALLKGGAVHSILEHHPSKSTHKLAPKYQDLANKFITSSLGERYLSNQSTREFRFGLNHKLEECSYNDKSCMFRGSIDFIAIINDILHLVDWKTGKLKDIRWQDFNQLMFYALYFFKKYPKINKIKITYIYVEHDTENDLILERKYLQNYISTLSELIREIETDIDFKKCPSKLCKWCPYIDHCKADI